MTEETAAETDEAPTGPKRSRLPLILGVALAVLGGAGGFLGMRMMAAPHASEAAAESGREAKPAPAPGAYLPLEPLTITLPGAQSRSHLRASLQLEVPPERLQEVEALRPRIVDVLNGYLRAVDLELLEDPSALMRLRAQMLRRIQVVAGEGRVDDLLIMEFVVN